ncbi:MobC family plasmid mobilization relaxosome protein [Williamsia sp. MIQD14]|uniref:MobC family plasmid mobilization relaxosome protein n=1 Tax=Williamsia sp. MIQD14 TaxID=3425703 RepID=UPI003DA08AA3
MSESTEAGGADPAPARRSVLRRRRANTPGGRQDKIEVKVTGDEDALLRARAALAGMSVQRLMVTRALSETTAAPVDYEVRRAAWEQACEVRNLLAAIGNNMNQIARNANTDNELPEDFDAAVTATHRAMRRVLDAFGETFGFEGRPG